MTIASDAKTFETNLFPANGRLSAVDIAHAQIVLQNVFATAADCFRLYTSQDLSFGIIGLLDQEDDNASLEPNEIRTSFSAKDLEDAVYLSYPRDLIFILTTVLYGGSYSEAPGRPEADFSAVEQRIDALFLETIANALSEYLQLSKGGRFRIGADDEETDPSQPAREASLATICWKLVMQIDGQVCNLTLRFAEKDLITFLRRPPAASDEATSSDSPGWQDKIQSGIGTTALKTSAVIYGPPITLEALKNLKVGQVIDFGRLDGVPVVLECAGRELFSCKMVQFRGQYSVQIEMPLHSEKPSNDTKKTSSNLPKKTS